MKGPEPSEVTGRPMVGSGLRTQSALWPSVAGPNALCLSFLDDVSITIVLTWEGVGGGQRNHGRCGLCLGLGVAFP